MVRVRRRGLKISHRKRLIVVQCWVNTGSGTRWRNATHPMDRTANWCTGECWFTLAHTEHHRRCQSLVPCSMLKEIQISNLLGSSRTKNNSSRTKNIRFVILLNRRTCRTVMHRAEKHEQEDKRTMRRTELDGGAGGGAL